LVLGGLGAGLLVGAFVLAERVGASALVAALVVGWWSPVLLVGPVSVYVAVLNADQRRLAAARDGDRFEEANRDAASSPREQAGRPVAG
jgi:hypothetical protein